MTSRMTTLCKRMSPEERYEIMALLRHDKNKKDISSLMGIRHVTIKKLKKIDTNEHENGTGRKKILSE